MKSRSIAIALAFGVSLVSTLHAQPIPQNRMQRLEAVAKQLNLHLIKSDNCFRFCKQRNRSCKRLRTTNRSRGRKNYNGSGRYTTSRTPR